MKLNNLIFFCAIAISGTCQTKSEDHIVLINVGAFDKGKIARLVSHINTLNPRVISLDIAFPEYVGNPDDQKLYKAFQNVKKLVLPSEISYHGKDYHGQDMISVHLTCAAEFFVPFAKTGFVSGQTEKDGHIPSQFIVWQEVNYSDYVYHHFSVVTAMAFDSLKTSKFIESHERLVELDFKNGKRNFKTFSASEILGGKLTKKDIEGKIVMMGFLGPRNTDKFVSPLSSDPTEPDMYGLMYLANIVAQILDNRD